MIDYKIVSAQKEDVSAIAKLISEILGAMNFVPSQNQSESFEAILKENEKAVLQVLDRMIVAKDSSGKIIGVCGLEKNTRGDFYQIGQTDYDEVSVLVIDAQYRKCGIGSRLLQEIARYNQRDIVFEGWGDNGQYANAHGVLVRSGFVHLKNLPHFYKERGDCAFCVHRDSCQEDLCTCDIYIHQKITD